MPCVLSADELQRAIVDDRKYIAPQFWKEISRETKRLEYSLSILALKATCSQDKGKYDVLKPLVEEIITALTTITDFNDTLVESAVQTVKNCWQNNPALDVHDVEAKAEDIRRYREISKSHSQKIDVIEDQPNTDLKTSETLRATPSTENLMKPETMSQKQPQTAAEECDDDINASDFTGAIEVEMVAESSSESSVHEAEDPSNLATLQTENKNKTKTKFMAKNIVEFGRNTSSRSIDKEVENPLAKIIAKDTYQTKPKVRRELTQAPVADE